jgi:hypothetical protein
MKVLLVGSKNKTRIEVVDYEIDQLVYKLYNLTAVEMRVVEKIIGIK